MRRLLTFIRADRFATNEAGAALAELAILLPFLILTMAAVSELGRLFQSYNGLSKSTRMAARYLSNVAFTNEQIAKAKNVAVCGRPDCTGRAPLAPGLTPDHIVVTPGFQEGGGGNPITVTISISNYTFRPLFHLTGMLPGERFTNVPIGSSTTMYYMWVDPAGVEE